MSLTHRTIAFRLLLGVMLSSLALSCKQYEYASPLPGVLEVRLKVVNSPDSLGGNREVIPFSPLSRFRFVLKELNAVQPGNVKLAIYEDLYARQRIDGGDYINTLDPLANTADIILGQAYAPPQTFTGLDMTVTFPDPAVIVVRDPRFGATFLPVVAPPPPAPAVQTFYQAPPAPQTINITVNEGRTTVVTVVFNLDSVLQRRSESFEFHPSFSISSVKNY